MYKIALICRRVWIVWKHGRTTGNWSSTWRNVRWCTSGELRNMLTTPYWRMVREARLRNAKARRTLEYGWTIAWNLWITPAKQLPKLIKFGERVRVETKLPKCLKNKSYDEWLRALGLTMLEERRAVRGDMIQVFKMIRGFDGWHKSDFFSNKNVTIIQEVMQFKWYKDSLFHISSRKLLHESSDLKVE